ncbi:MAG TPA: glycosyltransferase family 4 protein [Cytophagaceae bacterium]|jgi:glycosyltransferase involved in cell wall biosynthesis|nr:glycosyltransferase family 4 protein [Cytophagaceae bacterium]
MRILLIHQYFLEKNDSGGSRFNEMTRVWGEQGIYVTVLAGMIHANASGKAEKYKGEYFVCDRYDDKVEVIRCHVSESYNVNFIGRLWGYFSFVFFSLWAGVFKAKGKYDLILVTSPPLFVGITAYLLSKVKRIPYVFEIRDLWPESAIDTGVVTNKLIIRISYWLEAFVYKHARLINVLTPAFRDTLLMKKNVPASKLIYIPNAADFSLTEELLKTFDASSFRKEIGVKEDTLLITYVGAHGVANHLIQLIDVAEQIKDRPVLFLLIGDGMQKKMLKEETQKRGLTNVRFVDPVPKKEVFKYILASDLGASVLKKVDTFKTVYSNKTFDYMACKKPILMAIDGVSRQLVEEAEAGVYVEPENVKDYIEKIDFYLQNRSQLIIQGLRGYEYAKTSFDREKLAQQYLEHLKQI